MKNELSVKINVENQLKITHRSSTDSIFDYDLNMFNQIGKK
jgi:hypothetical protein